MPGVGQRRFEFVGEQPLIFRVLAALTVANAFIGLLLPYVLRFIVPRGFTDSRPCEELANRGMQYRVPGAACWYASRWVLIEFILLAMIVVVLLICRKRVRHIDLARW
jgi:hypothetical protein